MTGAADRRISSGGPWEVGRGLQPGGGHRRHVLGRRHDRCRSGRASLHPGDVAGQARAVFAIIERALIEGGFTLVDVVRTRMFVADMALAGEVSAVHGEVFGDIRPAATMVAVAALMHPSLLVEIEVDARRG